MSTNTLGLFLRHLALSEEVSRLGTVSDRDLLTAYEVERGQAAFTELMRRHGPMVLRTCRRVLGRGPDAEDAFQATFVLLARKAAQLRREAAGPLALGGWLHRVAYQTALDVLAKLTRRKAHERLAATMMPHADPVAEATWNEIQPILDAELDALPEQSRRLLIACYLQDKTYTEAAAELGLPRGSVAWRLEKARTLLAERLARRGIVVSVPLLALLLEVTAKGAGVPALLLVHTLEAARRFTLQMAGALSENVAQLVKGGLAKMTKGWTHWRMALVGWLGLLGAGLLACQALKAWPEQTPPSEAAERPAQEREKQGRTDLYGDPLPTEALARMGTTRLRHMADVYAVYFAPDGKTVVTREANDTLRLWDVASGKLVRSLKRPAGQGASPVLSFAGDGKVLASASTNQVWLWNVTTGERLRELKTNLKGEQQASSWAVSSDGKLAASGGIDAAIRLWDMASGKQLRVLQGKGKSMDLVSFSPDNKTLASMCEGDDRAVQLWDVSSGKLLHKLEYPQNGIIKISFSPDGKLLATAGTGKTKPPLRGLADTPSPVQLWDVATGKRLRTLEGHYNAVVSLTFSPDGKLLASGSWDQSIRLWDLTTGKELHKLNCPFTSNYGLAFAPDSKTLASVGTVPAVRLWEVATGKQLHPSQRAHTGHVRSVSFSPDGRTLVTAAEWGEGEDTIRLWDATSGKPLRTLKHPGGVHAVVFAPDGKTLASAKEGTIRLWDATTGKQLRKLEAPDTSTPNGMLLPLAFSLDSKLLATGTDNGKDPRSKGNLQLWDVATGTPLRALETLHQIASVAFSPDGKTLAVGTWEGTLHLWDTATGKDRLTLDKFPENRGCITTLSFSPDGKFLALGNGFCLLEVSSGRELHKLTGHTDQIEAVTFSPSGRWLASAGLDQTVRLWELNAGLAAECHQFRGHDAGVTSVAFSPDGRRLASGSHDSTALVWDVTGLAEKQGRALRLTNGELSACWQSLISMDASQAYQALRSLAATPEQTVPFLAERLFLKKPDPQQVSRLLAQLDSEEFRVRSQAAKELAKWGEPVEPALQRALRDNPSVEVRRRIQQLLEALDPPHPEGVSPRLLRWLRAVEVLEWIDTPASRELLKKLAVSPPREKVGQEAEAALKRLHAPTRP